MIVRKIPNVLPKFEDMLDHAITLAEHDINDVDCELKLDFKVLIPNQSKGESAMFINFIEIGHNHLLKHPLCESFLHLKWLKVRKFFFISLIFHSLFTLLQTLFVLQVYAGPQCVIKNQWYVKILSNFCHFEFFLEKFGFFSKNSTNNTREFNIPQWQSVDGNCFKPYEELCQIEWSTLVVWVFLLMSTFILGAKEAFQLMHSQKVNIQETIEFWKIRQ